MDLQALPLFPLNAVVFPGLPLQVSVFEERYKALVADALAGSQHFGVVAIASGPEVGGKAEPFMVGALMQIVSVDQIEDGRLNLVATAIERIELTTLDRDSKPYLVGSARLWPDQDSTAVPKAEVAAAQAMFNRYVAAILREVGSSEEEVSKRVPLSLPDDPLLLSILVSSMMQVPMYEKQDLLAAASTGERLRMARRLLNRELVLLRSAHAGPAVQPLGSAAMFSTN